MTFDAPEPGEASNETRSTTPLTLSRLLLLAIPVSMMLGLCALPNRVFSEELKVTEDISLYNYNHREVISAAILVFTYFMRWVFMKTCRSRVEHILLFVGMILFCVALIYWRISDWSELRRIPHPHPPHPLMLWIGIPIGMLAVPTVSFFLFDVHQKKISRSEFVFRWLIEIIVVIPFWHFLWGIFCMTIRWTSL